MVGGVDDDERDVEAGERVRAGRGFGRRGWERVDDAVDAPVREVRHAAFGELVPSALDPQVPVDPVRGEVGHDSGELAAPVWFGHVERDDDTLSCCPVFIRSSHGESYYTTMHFKCQYLF